MTKRPLVISAPERRTLDLFFHADRLAKLHARYDIREVAADPMTTLPESVLADARYVIGRPPINDATL